MPGRQGASTSSTTMLDRCDRVVASFSTDANSAASGLPGHPARPANVKVFLRSAELNAPDARVCYWEFPRARHGGNRAGAAARTSRCHGRWCGADGEWPAAQGCPGHPGPACRRNRQHRPPGGHRMGRRRAADRAEHVAESCVAPANRAGQQGGDPRQAAGLRPQPGRRRHRRATRREAAAPG